MPDLSFHRRRLLQLAALNGVVFGGAALGGATLGSARAMAQTLPVSGLFENLATLHVATGRLAHFLAALRANAVAARASDGNIGFNIFQNDASPNTLYVLEQWQDAAAYGVHMKQPALLAMHVAAKTDLQGAIERQILQPASAGTGPYWARPDMPQAVDIAFVELQVKPGMRDALLAKLAPLVPVFRAAPGNVSFDIYKTLDDPNGLVQIERWSTKQTHAANLKRPVIKDIRAAFSETLARSLADSRAELRDVTEG